MKRGETKKVDICIAHLVDPFVLLSLHSSVSQEWTQAPQAPHFKPHISRKREKEREPRHVEAKGLITRIKIKHKKNIHSPIQLIKIIINLISSSKPFKIDNQNNLKIELIIIINTDGNLTSFFFFFLNYQTQFWLIKILFWKLNPDIDDLEN